MLECIGEVTGADSLAGGVRDQCANEASRVSRFFFVLHPTGEIADERPGAVTHDDESLDLQIAIRLYHRGGVHAKLCGEPADRG